MSDSMLSQTRPVSRKKYRCEHCQTAIEPHTRYYKQSGVLEGEFYTFRAHEDCEQAAHDIWGHAGSMWDEGIVLIAEYEAEPNETAAFLLAEYPDVAERLGIRGEAA